MQKVEGSSPFIRFIHRNPLETAGFLVAATPADARREPASQLLVSLGRPVLSGRGRKFVPVR
jgi:hypothetical protein